MFSSLTITVYLSFSCGLCGLLTLYFLFAFIFYSFFVVCCCLSFFIFVLFSFLSVCLSFYSFFLTLFSFLFDLLIRNFLISPSFIHFFFLACFLSPPNARHDGQQCILLGSERIELPGYVFMEEEDEIASCRSTYPINVQCIITLPPLKPLSHPPYRFLPVQGRRLSMRLELCCQPLGSRP